MNPYPIKFSVKDKEKLDFIKDWRKAKTKSKVIKSLINEEYKRIRRGWEEC